jgi:hypothetical protein
VPVDQAYPTPPYQHGYADPYGYPAYPVARPTEGMAIGALVVSCVGIVGVCGYGIGGLIGIVGAILGHVARRRIRTTGANGEGLALTGIIMGWIAAAIGLVFVAGFIVLFVLGDGFGTTTT